MNDHFLRRLHPAFRRTRAQALVEMALVLPILVMLLTGVFEFGMILYAHVQVANAVREGARAASLYRKMRYATMASYDIGIICDTNANGSINGWSLDQAVRQAIVYHPLDDDGCPVDSDPSFTYASLGWLDPAPSPDMWQVDIINVEDTTFWPTSTNVQEKDDVMPDAGTRATVRLRYPYRLLIISNILPFLQDPIWISKSVQVEFQN